MKGSTVPRIQGNNKRLSRFISEIRESIQLLRIHFSEAKLVETILVGLSPAEQSHLALMPWPKTFAELEQYCIHSTNVCCADQHRLSNLV